MFAKTCLRVALALITITTVCSCCRLEEPPIRGEFEGVKAAIQRKSTVSVFICHGMGGYSEGDPCDLVFGIARQLCLRPKNPPCRRSIVGDDGKVYGCLTRHDFCGRRCPADVRFYILDWSATTEPEKDALRCVDNKILAIQVKMIKRLKAEFINSAMADVALYLGHFGPHMRYPIQQSLRWVYEDSRESEHHELVVVGFSMGGQMILDTLEDMRDVNGSDAYTNEVRRALTDEISAYFMVSNQIPLLQLAESEPRRRQLMFKEAPVCEECCAPQPVPRLIDPNCQNWDNTSLGEFILEKRLTDPSFQIVSISDPDDLLSYPCFNPYIPYQGEGALPAFAMLGVRESKYAILGFFVNPEKAHINYGENPKVVGYISHGRQCCCRSCRAKRIAPCAVAEEVPTEVQNLDNRPITSAN